MPNILHRVGIAAEPARVFETLTNVEGIKNRWSSETQSDASEGGAFQFRKNRLEVVHADPSLVVWHYSGPAEDWVGTEIRFRLEWREDQTFVLFSHEGWREPNEFMHHCSTKWAPFLLSLKDLVENGKGRPEPRDTKITVNAWERAMTTSTDLDDVSAIVGAFETQLGSRTIPFAMIARFRVTETSQARVEQAFEKAVPPTLREPGVLAYQPHRDPTDTAGFVVYERWKSLDDLEAHLCASYIADLRQEIDAVITGAPEFNLLRPL